MRPSFLLLALLLCTAPALAQDTILVTNTGNAGPGSLRAAVAEANATPGPQTIAFNIPTTDPGYNASLGVFYVVLESSGLTLTDDGTTIDGTTQTAFTGDTNPHGPELGVRASILDSHISVFALQGDGNVIREIIGFHYARYGVEISGDGNRVEGCAIIQPLQAGVYVTGTDNTIGGTAPEAGNRISSSGVGVHLATAGATGNDVLNNRISNNNAGGMTVEGPDNRIGAPGAGNVFVQNGRITGEQYTSGHHLSVSGSGNVVQGNFIGVEADGVTSAAFPASVGLQVSGPNTLVGGRAEGEGNVFGGFGFYIHIADRRRALVLTGAGSVAEGNRIGLGLDGTTPLPSREGTVLGANVRFGGTAAGAGNLVAHAQEVGVVVNPGATGAAVLGNRIFGSGDLGLDLGNDGPTANDPQDPDEGANRRQNHPVLTTAALSGSTLTVTYAVDTAPAHATYPLRVEFFRADADGDEGEVFLGADTYTETDYGAGTPGQKTVSLDVSGAGLGTGDLVLATATDAAGNTSEFGAAVAMQQGAAVAVDAAPVSPPVVIGPGGGSFEFTVAITNTSSEPLALRAWTAVEGPADRDPVLGPQSFNLPAGATLTRTLMQRVPGNAPAGTYTYTVYVGAAGGGVLNSDSFTFVKEGNAPMAAREQPAASRAWAVSGWDDVAAASAAATEGLALSEAYPNPSSGQARLTLEVAEAQAVRAEVFDTLGRRVAVLLDEQVEAGAHALVLDGSALPAGVYVVRVTGEAFTATRRVTLAR